MYNLTIPTVKIPIGFLKDADKMVKTPLKDILNLSTDTPDAMLKLITALYINMFP